MDRGKLVSSGSERGNLSRRSVGFDIVKFWERSDDMPRKGLFVFVVVVAEWVSGDGVMLGTFGRGRTCRRRGSLAFD